VCCVQRIRAIKCSETGGSRAGTDQKVNSTSFSLAFTPCLWLAGSLHLIPIIRCTVVALVMSNHLALTSRKVCNISSEYGAQTGNKRIAYVRK
jgi:hypothetical protein